MSIAVLNQARSFVVPTVPIDDQLPWQRIFAKDRHRDLSRSILAKLKDAQITSGKKPDVSVFPVGSPTGLVCVPHRSLSVFLDELLRHLFKQTGASLKYPHEATAPNTKIFADPLHRNTVQVVHGNRVGNKLIPKEALRKNTRGLWGETLATVGTISLV